MVALTRRNSRYATDATCDPTLQLFLRFYQVCTGQQQDFVCCVEARDDLHAVEIG